MENRIGMSRTLDASLATVRRLLSACRFSPEMVDAIGSLIDLEPSGLPAEPVAEATPLSTLHGGGTDQFNASFNQSLQRNFSAPISRRVMSGFV